jgi:hypothetical protein
MSVVMPAAALRRSLLANKRLCLAALALGIVLLWFAGKAHATLAPTQAFQLGTFASPDGAITVTEGGDTVDPYFAMKVLLLAEGRHDAKQVTDGFIAWMLQRPDALSAFGRYCKTAPLTWSRCSNADADDVTAAFWLVLTEDAPHSERLTQSRAAASALLSHLFDPARGVYRISPRGDAALFMDNCEIAHALAMRAAKVRQPERSVLLRQRQQLLVHMKAVFPMHDGLPAVSTEGGVPSGFYPEDVAGVFVPLERLPMADFPGLLSYSVWAERYAGEWLSGNADVYPWGLVALVSQDNHDSARVTCWQNHAQVLRHSPRWNVLEEAVWQLLPPPTNQPTCS